MAAPGELYRRVNVSDENKLRFEVVMNFAVDSPRCKDALESEECRELGIRVDTDATIGHFAIVLTGEDRDSLSKQWLMVTNVVIGQIFDEQHKPLAAPLELPAAS